MEHNLNHLTLLRVNPTKFIKILKQFIGFLPTNCLSVTDHGVGLALKGLISEGKFDDDSLI